jgi:saccharopine dehydrogenase-like NADP-dependent oxidoreductase
MRIAVFGGAGAMGRVVVQELAASPVFSEVVLADVDVKRAEQVYEAMAQPPNVRVQQVDIDDRSRLQALLKDVDLVANCAFYTMNEALDQQKCLADVAEISHIHRKRS